MLTKVHVRKHERALWFRDGDFKRVLAPGSHRLWSRLWNWGDRVEKADTLKTRFEHVLLDVMLSDSRLHDQLVVLDLNDAQRALVWRDERLFQIVGPGKHAYWIVPAKLDVETYSVNEFASSTRASRRSSSTPTR